MKVLIPDAASINEKEPGHFVLLDNDGKICGRVMEYSEESQQPTGFGGKVPVSLVIGADGRIAGVIPGKNSETPGFFKRVLSSGLFNHWNGKTPSEARGLKVDAVTSATYTSRAVIKGVRELSARADGRTAQEDSMESEKEIDALRQRIQMASYILARSTILLQLRQERRAEEIHLRELIAVQGIDAAMAYAKDKGLMVSGHFMQGIAKSRLVELGKLYQKSQSDGLLAQIRDEATRDLDESLKGLLPHNVQHAKSILAAMDRLSELQGK
ncbi:MAG: FMN-binding protein [Victivallales bacterium]|nr:FMN-binding protein [Victivallales bacterium]